MKYYAEIIFNWVRGCAYVSLLFFVVGLSHTASASTLDDIRELEAGKGQATLPAVTPQQRVPDGRQVNAADYRIVLFMQGSCHYCQQFDPTLSQLSAQTGLKVFPYTLDGQGDASFPDAIPAPRAVLDQFFGPGNNGVTPTTWLVNVNTLESWPLAQGLTDMTTLLQRINKSLMVK